MRTNAIIRYPKKKPNVICMYEKAEASTFPGTEIKVIPERVAPSIPNATTYQGDCLSPKKKLALLSDLPVK